MSHNETPKNYFSVWVLAVLLLLQWQSWAGPGAVDLSFDSGSSVDRTIFATAVQSDGKIVVGGEFYAVRDLIRNRIARLNSDGRGDPSFNPGLGTDGTVWSVAIQTDGKVLIGGAFTKVNDVIRNRIARLNADGSLDDGFNAGANGTVHAIVVQGDGKILVGGAFTSVNNSNQNRMVRLNADGELDAGFSAGIASNTSDPSVYSIAVQEDGKVLIGGGFLTVSSFSRRYVARLNTNGVVDTSFSSGMGPNSHVRSIAIRTDGKVVIGGYFTTVNNTNRNRIARLNADGQLDTTFDPGAGANDGIRSVVLQPDNSLIIGGEFTTINNMNRNRFARLLANGNLDSSFNPGPGPNGPVWSVARQTDGLVLIGGEFRTINGIARNYLARISTDGSLDPSLDPGLETDREILAVKPEIDGKVLIGGTFTTVNGISRKHIARLDTNGSPDISFNAGNVYDAISPEVSAIVVQTNGRVVIGGRFTHINGTNLNRIARLHADGSLDSSFTPGTGAQSTLYDSWIAAVALQPDSKVLIGGGFTTFNGTNRNRIARLHANGDLDTTFNPGSGANNAVLALAVQTDGKVIIGGVFGMVNGTNRNCIARLNANGGLDTSFNPGTGANNGVASVALQTDGKILIGGAFTAVNGTNRNHIARLNPDGSLDSTFDSGTEIDTDIYSIVLQTDGKMIVGGSTYLYGTNRTTIARLHPNGTRDMSFNSGTGANGSVKSLGLQMDGKVLVGGSFSGINGVARSRVARLWGGNPLSPIPLTIQSVGDHVTLSWTNAAFLLQAAPFVTGTYTNVGGATSPYTNPIAGSQQYFRLVAD